MSDVGAEFLQDPLGEIRAQITARLNEPMDRLGREHGTLESLERSPFLSDFEDFYRRKIALGKLTLQEVFQKIDAAVLSRGITFEEAQHMKEHLVAQPPTLEDIEAAVAEEARKLRDKEEQAIQGALDEARRRAQELAELATRQREERRQRRQQKRDEEVSTLFQNRRVSKGGRTLSFGKNGQLYVFVRGKRGRSKMTAYYRKLQKLLRGMRQSAELANQQNITTGMQALFGEESLAEQ